MKMYYYGARYYDPEISMWISVDPAINKYLPDRDRNKTRTRILGRTNEMSRIRMYKTEKEQVREKIMGLPNDGIYNSKNLGLYSYTGNNPVVYIDPDGEVTLKIGWLITGEIAVKAGSIEKGIILGFDFEEGFQIGKYTTIYKGKFATDVGIFGGIKVGFSTAKNIMWLKGKSLDISGTFGMPVGIQGGLEYNVGGLNLDKKEGPFIGEHSYFSIETHLGFGIGISPVDISAGKSKTFIDEFEK